MAKLPGKLAMPILNKKEGRKVKYSEELKEAVLRAKGKGVFVATIEQDDFEFIPECFDIVRQTDDELVLKVRRPEAVTPEKTNLVEKIVSRLEPQLKETIVDSVRKALLEKSEKELIELSKVEKAKVERRRGCFWVITDTTEHLL